MTIAISLHNVVRVVEETIHHKDATDSFSVTRLHFFVGAGSTAPNLTVDCYHTELVRERTERNASV